MNASSKNRVFASFCNVEKNSILVGVFVFTDDITISKNSFSVIARKLSVMPKITRKEQRAKQRKNYLDGVVKTTV